MHTLITEVLGEFGLELRQLRVKYPRDSFFSKGHRAAAVAVEHLTASPAADEMYPGRKKLSLGFDLPRGSYATILVKRLTERAQPEAATQEPAVTDGDINAAIA
jgi:tRNA pseudouridine13 synthase